MVALVCTETVLLVLLVVLVAGLLRSHAEILRRLGPASADLPPTAAADAQAAAPLSPPLSVSRAVRDPHAPALAGTAPALAGATPCGDAIKLGFDGVSTTTSAPTLLAFLSSGCATCAAFWEGLSDRRVAPHVQSVIVTRSADRERPSRLRSLAHPGVPVVMSSQAWEDYGVPGSPYFVLVDGAVQGEGVATTWTALASLVGDAIEDQRELASGKAGIKRARSIEATLAAAGIGREHPSLHPGPRSRPDGDARGAHAQ